MHILRLMQSAATFVMFLHFISMSHSSRHQQCNGYLPYMDLMQRLNDIFFSECDLNAGHGLVMEWDAKLIQSSFIRTVSRRAQSSANVCGALTIYRDIWGGRFPCTIHFGGVYFQFLFLFFFFLMRIGDGRDYGLTIYLGVSETKDAHTGAWALVSAPQPWIWRLWGESCPDISGWRIETGREG